MKVRITCCRELQRCAFCGRAVDGGEREKEDVVSAFLSSFSLKHALRNMNGPGCGGHHLISTRSPVLLVIGISENTIRILLDKCVFFISKISRN